MIKNRNFLQSFACAIRGIGLSLKSQRNMRFHLMTAIAVLVAALLVDVSEWEFLLIVIAIAIVMVAELVNSAMETSVDLVTKEYHPLARDAKDMAAGGVLFGAMMAAVVGLVVFLSHGRLLVLWQKLTASIWSAFLTLAYVIIALLFIFIRKNQE